MIKGCVFLFIIISVLTASSVSAQTPSILALPALDSVQVKIINTSAYPTGTNVLYYIRHWPDNTLFASGQISASQIANDGIGYPSFRIQGLQPQLWTLQDPQLYTIQITKTDGTSIGETRFGFRTFEVKNRKFYLNGRPIFLRSNPINPPGRDLPYATGADPAFIRAYLTLLKNAGVNLIRTETDAWFNVCDELGIMVSQCNYSSAPGGSADAPPPVESGKIAYRNEVLPLANHPSVTIYILTNEVDYTSYKSFLEAIRADLLLLDPTRPVIGNAGFGKGEGGEIYDHHRYLGWYYGNAHDWYELNDTLALSDAQNQPLTVSEYVAAYTSDAGVFQTLGKQLSTSIRWTGAVADQRGAALEYQAELTRQAVEIARRLRTSTKGVAGIMPFTYFFGWANARSADDLIIKPAFEVLKTVFQPVLISPECWKRNIYAGDNLQMRIYVINDDDSGRSIGACQAHADVTKTDGTVVASGQVSYSSVPYYSNAWADLTIPIPSSLPKGNYRVRLRLVEGGQVISKNNFEITVAPREWAKATGISVTLYDPGNTTTASLQQLGVNYTKISSLTFPQSGVLIIGETALGSTTPNKADVLAFLNRGGRILCLRQSSLNSSWLPANFTMSASYRQSCVHPIGGNQAIFEGLSDKDLRFWNEVSPRYSNGTPVVDPVLSLLWPASHADLSPCRVWAASEQLLSGGALIELFYGNGSIIISQFRCTERTANDPIAAKLLANLIKYTASTDHHGMVNLSRTIKWNTEAFRTGVFCSKVQGFLPHSPVYQHDGSSKGQLGDDHSIDGFTLVGNYNFNRQGWITPVPDPLIDGWGVFYGRLTGSATKFRATFTNLSQSSSQVRLKLDGVDVGSPVTLTGGQQKAVDWTISRAAGPVKVELIGSQKLLLTETRFY